MEETEVANSFVSINLETSTCSFCGLDTAEPLTSCHLCQKNPTAKGPIQMGFNKLPDMLHSGVKAHETCLFKEHQMLLRKSRSLSPFLHRRGCSVPNDFSSLGTRESIGDKLHWLVNHAKNEDVRNRKNLLQVHSSPCTRSSSPVGLRVQPETSEMDILRRNSENNLTSCDSGSAELRKSYAKYLYGSRLTQSHSDDNVVRKTNSLTSVVMETSLFSQNTSVPDVRKDQTQLSNKNSKKEKRALKKPTTENNNKIEMTDVPTPGLDKLCDVLTQRNEETEKRDVGSETQRWSNKQKLNKEQLNKMSAAELKKVVSGCGNIIKEISAELVDFLQERDSLDQEVKVRNLTIQKLVKMKHQQEMPIKTAGVGNI